MKPEKPEPLRKYNPRWMGAGGSGIFDAQGNPVPEREGIGIIFDCPCGNPDDIVAVEFDPPLDGKPPHRKDGHVWKRTGDTFDTLTLHPSILRVGGCEWHGWVRNGLVVRA